MRAPLWLTSKLYVKCLFQLKQLKSPKGVLLVTNSLHLIGHRLFHEQLWAQATEQQQWWRFP
jgi:hypothetical protein